MKKLLKASLTFLLSIAILLSGTIIVFADEGSQEITPRYNVASQKIFTFAVSNNKATVRATYSANSSTFQKANLTVKIEKNFLLLFWTTVDIGYTNNEWKTSSTNPNGVFSNSFAVSGTGKYRAKITLEIIGNNGQRDLIEETLEYEYK